MNLAGRVFFVGTTDVDREGKGKVAKSSVDKLAPDAVGEMLQSTTFPIGPDCARVDGGAEVERPLEAPMKLGRP